MTIETLFRFSTHLSLALACVCVGYAEAAVLPEVLLIAAAVVVSLVVLFRLETRVELLSIASANRLGLGLGVANLIWMAGRVTWELQHQENQSIPWQLLLAAMFGPLLLTAMPAKLARREKHTGDYWTLQGMGLIAVCLAGAIADDVAAIVLIVLYAVASLWSLCLLYQRQAGGAIPGPLDHDHRRAPIAVAGRPTAQFSLAQVIALICFAAILAVPVYLLTPNSPAKRLSFNGDGMEIGYSHEAVCSLNLTGELRANDAIAFEVFAEAGGRPVTDLSPEQRWSGRILKEYRKGEWRSPEGATLPSVEPNPRTKGGAWSPPSLGPDQITLTFTVPPRHQGGFLADPIAWAENQPPPVATLKANGPREWQWGYDGQFLQLPDRLEKEGSESLRYVQVWRSQKDPDLSPPIQLINARTQALAINPVPKVQEYAETLLKEMTRAGTLPADFRDPVRLLPRPEFHDAIAHAFSSHLATAPEFTYTTNLLRQRKDLDPVEDFLFYTRSGHCEAFASALALLLRSQGIPAVLVLGFKGCDPGGEPGKYIVREQYAHAWVAALIQEYEPRTRNNARNSRWRSLDPTPSGEEGGGRAAGASKSASSLESFNQRIRAFFFTYTAEERQRAIGRFFIQYRAEVLGCAGAIVALALLTSLGLRWRRRRSTPPEAPANQWLESLSNRLRPFGITQLPSETPLEFASRAAETLRKKPETLALADVPIDWVEAYYEARFGDRPISQARRLFLEERLDELRCALA